VPHVASEAIAQIEYDAATRTLFVCFSDGDWYGYAGVPPAVHEAFVAAPSHGRFFHDHIREAYPHTGRCRSDGPHCPAPLPPARPNC